MSAWMHSSSCFRSLFLGGSTRYLRIGSSSRVNAKQSLDVSGRDRIADLRAKLVK